MKFAKARKLLYILSVLVATALLCVLVGCGGGSGDGDNAGNGGGGGNAGGGSGADRCSHEWVTETIQPTCDTDGAEIKTCSKCGETETDTIRRLGHEFDYTFTDDTYTAPSSSQLGLCEYPCTREGCEEKDVYGEIEYTMVNTTMDMLTYQTSGSECVITGYNTTKYSADQIREKIDENFISAAFANPHIPAKFSVPDLRPDSCLPPCIIGVSLIPLLTYRAPTPFGP